MTQERDYEKMLRVYIRHVTHREGTDFLPSYVRGEEWQGAKVA